MTKSSQWAIAAARRTSSRGASGRPQLLAIVGELDAGKIASVDCDLARLGPVEGRDEADQRALSGAGRTDERGGSARFRDEGDSLEHRDAGLILELDVLELDPAFDAWQRLPSFVS